MLEIRQLLAGRDFAKGDPTAGQMANFVYLVADRASREAVLVDPAWAVKELVDLARAEGLKLVGAIATHAHADHVGGSLMGFRVEGVLELVGLLPVPVWVHEADAAKLLSGTGLTGRQVRQIREGNAVPLGGARLHALHTPGHSPGSQCLLAGKGLLTGDTLFVDECGRVDLPGSEPDRMFESLRRLAALPEGTVVYPGHNYGPKPTATIGEQRRTNPCLAPKTVEGWRRFVAG